MPSAVLGRKDVLEKSTHLHAASFAASASACSFLSAVSLDKEVEVMFAFDLQHQACCNLLSHLSCNLMTCSS
jgi:hypothetical protein